MKKFLLFLLLLVLLATGSTIREKSYYFESDEPHGEVLLHVEGGKYYCLDKTLPQNTAAIKTIYEQTELGKFHSYEMVLGELNGLSEKYPSKCHTVSLGQTIEGRDIMALRFQPEKPSPAFLFMGCHHAREWMSVEVPLRLAHILAENPGNDKRIDKYLANYDIWVIPMVNPDGHSYSVKENRLWRKNRTKQQGGSVGVDLNRNYGYKWSEQGASGDPSDETYHGNKPFSENETSIIKTLSEEIPIIGCLTYHTFGELILYPWGYTKTKTSFDAKLAKLAEGMAKISGSPNDNDYKEKPLSDKYDYIPMQASGLYESSGDCTDFLFAEFGTPAFTIEMGETKDAFAPPDTMIEPTINQVMEFNFYLMEESPKEFGILYGKVTDIFKNPVQAKITIPGLDQSLKIDPGTGKFFRVLPKGKYLVSYGKNQKKLVELKDNFQRVDFVVESDQRVSLSGQILDQLGKPVKRKLQLLDASGNAVEGTAFTEKFVYTVPTGYYTIRIFRQDMGPQDFKVTLKSNIDIDLIVRE